MAKRVRWALPALAGVAAAAGAVGAYAAATANVPEAPFGLSAQPAYWLAAPGALARYRIVIHRHGFAAPLSLWVRGQVPESTERLVFASRTASKAALIVSTRPSTPPATYRLRLGASSGHHSTVLLLTLRIDAPQRAAFRVEGNTATPLEPGRLTPLNLDLSNPNRRPILVTSLTVSLTSLTAPRATALHPCSLGDFAVWQYVGAYPLAIPARGSRTLAGLGIPSVLWPQVAILNRPMNQDGCQAATITLSYGGSARTR